MKNKKNKQGITLISLVITIVILLILGGISIVLLKEDDLLNKMKIAKDETNKSKATETINLKIINIQMLSYVENQELPSLQYLADKLCEDNEMEYVLTESKDYSSLDKIDVSNVNSIFTKLKNYSYEFEINSSLQLASIDGVKISTNAPTSDNSIISMTKSELEKLIENKVESELSKYSLLNSNSVYSESEQAIGKWINGKTIYRKVIQTMNPNCTKDGTIVNNDIDVSDLNIEFVTSLNSIMTEDSIAIMTLPGIRK